MATILKAGRLVEEVCYEHIFSLLDCPGSGYAFPCDEQGIVPPESSAAFTARMGEASKGQLVYEGVQKRTWTWRDPTIIACVVCGEAVALEDAWLSSCRKCGADYNGSGQHLAPRDQWGEETGESLADMLNGREW